MMQSPLKRFGVSVKIIGTLLIVINLLSVLYTTTVPIILVLALGIILIVNSVVHFMLHLKTPSIFRSIDLTFFISFISAILGVYLIYNLIQFIYF